MGGVESVGVAALYPTGASKVRSNNIIGTCVWTYMIRYGAKGLKTSGVWCRKVKDKWCMVQKG